eukprot:Rhum_TRINITY_DN3386_c0_g1::Rhum_TRINITY_DN3386_c0_g1_i1::g.10377::m.10377
MWMSIFPPPSAATVCVRVGVCPLAVRTKQGWQRKSRGGRAGKERATILQHTKTEGAAFSSRCTHPPLLRVRSATHIIHTRLLLKQSWRGRVPFFFVPHMYRFLSISLKNDEASIKQGGQGKVANVADVPRRQARQDAPVPPGAAHGRRRVVHRRDVRVELRLPHRRRRATPGRRRGCSPTRGRGSAVRRRAPPGPLVSGVGRVAHGFAGEGGYGGLLRDHDGEVGCGLHGHNALCAHLRVGQHAATDGHGERLVLDHCEPQLLLVGCAPTPVPPVVSLGKRDPVDHLLVVRTAARHLRQTKPVCVRQRQEKWGLFPGLDGRRRYRSGSVIRRQ